MSEEVALQHFIKESNIDNSVDVAIHIRSAISNLVYSPDVEEPAFLNVVQFLGKLLGFDSSQPEKETGVGPDNLWIGKQGFILESKNQATSDKISQDYVEQLVGATAWYNAVFPKIDGIMVMFHPSYILDDRAYADKDVYVVTQGCLDMLTDAIFNLSNMIGSRNLSELSTNNLQNMMNQTGLIQNQFIQKFTKKAKRLSK